MSEVPIAPESMPSRESELPSPHLQRRVAEGVFDEQTPLGTETPKTISQRSLAALRGQNTAIRQKDEEKFAAKLRESSPSISNENVRDTQMKFWTVSAVADISHDFSLKAQTAAKDDFARALAKLGLGILEGSQESATLTKQLYDDQTKTEGAFYKKYCGTNMNEALANDLTVEDMLQLRGFLTKWMVGTNEAFEALLVLRAAQDTIASEAGRIQLSGTETLSDKDRKTLAFYKKGDEIAAALKSQEEVEKEEPEKLTRTDELPAAIPEDQLPPPDQIQTTATGPDKDAVLAMPTLSPEQLQKAEAAKAEIFTKARSHERSPEDVKALIAHAKDSLQKEYLPQNEHFYATAQEMQEHFANRGIVRKGQEVFIPKFDGDIVSIGDIHGDLLSIENVLEKTHFIEKMESGNMSLKLMFHGDLVDRGKLGPEVMEAVLALKVLYPENVILLGADHEMRWSVEDTDFEDQLRTRFQQNALPIQQEYQALFQMLPNIAVSGHGTAFVHGGVPIDLLDLRQLSEITDPKQIQDIFQNQMTWADIPLISRGNSQNSLVQQRREIIQRIQDYLSKNSTTPDGAKVDPNDKLLLGVTAYRLSKTDLENALAVMQQHPDVYFNPGRLARGGYVDAMHGGLYFMTPEHVRNFAQRNGLQRIVRGHQPIDTRTTDPSVQAFGDLVITTHTTGRSSKESAFPMYVTPTFYVDSGR